MLDIAAHPAMFVSPATNDFHLSTGSTLVDEDATVLAAGESATDLLGRTRIVAGSGTSARSSTAADRDRQRSGVGPLGPGGCVAGGGVSDGGSVTYVWSFGDGTGGATATPNHTYLLPGTYNWSLTVGDGEGARRVRLRDDRDQRRLADRCVAPDQITDTSVVLHGP